MRNTRLVPVECLSKAEEIRLADDIRHFKVLSIESPGQSGGLYRISVQAEDGLATVLSASEGDLIAVWVRAIAPAARKPVYPFLSPTADLSTISRQP